MTQINISVKQNTLTDIENRSAITIGEEGLGEGRIGSLELADANYHI